MIDWSSLPTLIGPRFKRILAERGDRERLARAHMRRAKGPKNHSTNKERSYADRERVKAARKLIQQHTEELEKYRAQVRAYWNGEREDHP